MKTILVISQIVVSVLLILTILLQEKGVGLGAGFGGGGEFYKSKRGADKILLYGTATLAVLFIAIAVAFLFV